MKTRRSIYALGLLLVWTAGLLLRYAGLTQPLGLHPDEWPVSRWMMQMDATHSLLPNVYAGGFFVLADAVRKLLEWTVLNPLHRWAYFMRSTNQFTPPPFDVIAFGRQFNVWLGALTILLTAWLARRITRSRAGALTAAALMAFAAFPIEHAHYLETDIAMLATTSLALLFMARTLATGRRWTFALAAFATGFAAGTKFPLALLVVPLLATLPRLVPPYPAAGRRRWAASLFGLLTLAVLLSAAGFVTATPDAREVSRFATAVKERDASMNKHADLRLGPVAADTCQREWTNFVFLGRFLKSMGWGAFGIAACGIPLCLWRRFRPFWPVSLLFPGIFVGYLVFCSPWIRSQEFMTLLPNVCLWVALPVAVLWNAGHPGGKTLAFILSGLAMIPALHRGAAVSSQFAWEDTRWLANRALKTCFPLGRALGSEHYVTPADDKVSAHGLPLMKFEAADPAKLRANSTDYVLVNADTDGRYVRNPLTGRPYPRYAANLEALLEHGQRLAAWGALDAPGPQPTFRSPRIELWACPAESNSINADLGVDLPRPTIVRDADRTTFFRGDQQVGPRAALRVDKYPREIAIGGPGRLDRPVFLIFSTRERAATVRAEGFGRSQRLALGPYDTGIIPMQRPWWRPAWSRFERVTVRAETGGPDLTYLPCFLRVAFAPLDAADILLDEGHPGQALRLLRQQEALPAAGPFWQALAGAPEAAEPAQALLARWDRWLACAGTNPPPVSSRGIPLKCWQDFARIRLVEWQSEISLYLNPSPVAPTNYITGSWAQILPLRGVQQYLAISLGRSPDASGNTNFSGAVSIDANDQVELGRIEFRDLPDLGWGYYHWSAAMTNSLRELSLSFHSQSGGGLRIAEAEYSWSWRDMLAWRRTQLAHALAAAPPAPARVHFGDWLALRECRVEGRQLVVTFEALQDDPPPVVVQLQVYKHRHWRDQSSVPLTAFGSAWPTGARRTVRLPMAADFTPDRIGVAVRTDVQWHSSLLPMAGAPAARPFPLLADLLP